MRGRLSTAVGLLTAALSLGWATPASGQSGLHILLTNDDGDGASALEVLATVLRNEGHRVSIVAPAENRSGSSMSMSSSGALRIEQVGEGRWTVDGTPSDAVSVGLVFAVREDPPDLVISGPNFGENAGANVLQSGTVGAALTAARSGIPAIALSVGIDLREAASDTPFGSTIDAFEPASHFVAEVVRQLAESSGEGFLPPRSILNINYPAVGADEPTGVRFATVSSVRAFRQIYAINEDSGEVRVQTVEGATDRAEEGSDVALLKQDFVTLSLIGGSLDLGPDAWEPLLRRLVIERVP